MIRKTGGWTAAVMAMAIVGFAGAPRYALAQGSKWQADHDAGWKAYQEGRLDEAETRLRAAEKEAEGFGANDPRLATTLDHLSWVLCTEGKSAEAEPLAKRALAIREQALGAEHPDVATSLETLGWLYAKQGQLGEAEPLLKRALAIYEKTLGPDHPHVARCCAKLAHACCAQGRNDEAESCCKQALVIYEKTPGADPINFAKALDEYATVLRKTDRAAEVEKVEARARALREGRGHTHTPK
jgi:tetratricopeptide (TPR) repeat protein